MGVPPHRFAHSHPAAAGSNRRRGLTMRLSHQFVRYVSIILAGTFAATCAGQAAPRLPGELTWTIGYDPKTFDPAKVDDQESELVRYLTAGVLLRFNRAEQK